MVVSLMVFEINCYWSIFLLLKQDLKQANHFEGKSIIYLIIMAIHNSLTIKVLNMDDDQNSERI